MASVASQNALRSASILALRLDSRTAASVATPIAASLIPTMRATARRDGLFADGPSANLSHDGRASTPGGTDHHGRQRSTGSHGAARTDRGSRPGGRPRMRRIRLAFATTWAFGETVEVRLVLFQGLPRLVAPGHSTFARPRFGEACCSWCRSRSPRPGPRLHVGPARAARLPVRFGLEQTASRVKWRWWKATGFGSGQPQKAALVGVLSHTRKRGWSPLQPRSGGVSGMTVAGFGH